MKNGQRNMWGKKRRVDVFTTDSLLVDRMLPCDEAEASHDNMPSRIRPQVSLRQTTSNYDNLLLYTLTLDPRRKVFKVSYDCFYYKQTGFCCVLTEFFCPSTHVEIHFLHNAFWVIIVSLSCLSGKWRQQVYYDNKLMSYSNLRLCIHILARRNIL